MTTRGVLLDIDGTLIDSTYLHTLAWGRALRSLGEAVPGAILHRLIGMGGDKLVPAAVGHAVEGAEEAYGREFARFHDELTLLPGARQLVARLVEGGFAVVLASSAREEDLEVFRDLLDVDDLLTGATSSGDAEDSKPDAEILEVAMARHGLDAEHTVVIGDTVWDGLAAQRAGIRFVAVETGGNPHDALVGAGARRVYADVAAVAADLDDGPLADLE